MLELLPQPAHLHELAVLHVDFGHLDVVHLLGEGCWVLLHLVVGVLCLLVVDVD